MVNIQIPSNPVHKRGMWPPTGYREKYPIQHGDNWWKVAKKFNVDVWDLIDFNFKTRIPEEVNYYLRELVGCRTSTDRWNYSFAGADPKKAFVYIPPLAAPPPSPQPPKKTFEQVLAELEMEVDADTSDPRRPRYRCMISKIRQGGDARVIYWRHIAPDDQTPAPPWIERRGLGVSAVDPQWLYENIKSWEDVDKQPPGEGMGFRKFVTSLRLQMVDPFPIKLFNLRGLHDDIIKTHDMLEKWSNAPLGGSSSMPREYRAIKEWVRRMESDKTTVLSCVISSP